MTDYPEHTRKNTLGLLRWVLLVGVAAAVLAFAMTLVARSISIDSPVPPENLGLDFPPPDFRLATLDGGELGPPDFAGKVVVLDFWATWCGPCRLQAAVIEQLREKVDLSQVAFLAVDVGEDRETVAQFVADEPFSYPVLLDEDSAVSSRYQVHGLPTVLVINKEGAVTYHNVGITDGKQLAAELARAGLEDETTESI